MTSLKRRQALTAIGVLLAGPVAAKDPVAPAPLPAPGASGGSPLQAGGQQLAGDPTTNRVGLRLFSLQEDPGGAPPAPVPAPAVAPAPPSRAAAGDGAAKDPEGSASGSPAPNYPTPSYPAPSYPAPSYPAPGSAAPAAGKLPPERQLSAPTVPTRFMPSAAVSQQVRQRILLSLAPQLLQVRAQVAAGQPWQEFDQLLRSYGYSSQDLGDVLTAYYIIAWEIATGGDAAREFAGIAAVRRAVGDMLAREPAFARLTDVDRQVSAELLAFFTVIAAGLQNGLRRQGRAGELQGLRDQVAAILLDQGIALRRFRLTPAGFVRVG